MLKALCEVLELRNPLGGVPQQQLQPPLGRATGDAFTSLSAYSHYSATSSKGIGDFKLAGSPREMPRLIICRRQRVNAVPEPSTWAMLLLLRWRRLHGLPSKVAASVDCGLIFDHLVAEHPERQSI
jgi:hypothetical protein